MFQYLTIEQKGFTRIITLNRPDVLNALNQQLLHELYMSIGEALEDHATRGVIITGAGEKAFAAGADIAQLAALDEEGADTASEFGQDVFFAIEHASKPVIAAVNGFALGGGCELAMACHFRIASEKAQFGQPEVKLGLVAGYGGTQRLPRLIGRGYATELLITADRIDAATALSLGLVNRVVATEALISTCEEILQKTYEQSPKAVALTLEAIGAGYRDLEGYHAERTAFARALSSEDGREGVQAFLEKRKPRFTGN